MLALKDISFIDLYLGNDFSEIKGLNGATTFLSDLSSEYAEDAQNLKKACEEIYNSSKKLNFRSYTILDFSVSQSFAIYLMVLAM